jgi:hypothetical protein
VILCEQLPHFVLDICIFRSAMETTATTTVDWNFGRVDPFVTKTDLI